MQCSSVKNSLLQIIDVINVMQANLYNRTVMFVSS